MKKNLALLAFVLLKIILQFIIINPAYDLQRDEYLHLDQGNHLAWGYISVPPVSSWIAALIKLLGNSEYWVKFFPALFGALTIVVVWKAVETLGGGWFALCASATALLLSVLLRINMLFQPNSLDIFFWTFTYFTIIRYIASQSNKWHYVMGLVIAFGILSKYNIAFLLAGLFPALAISSNRRAFANPHLYIAACIAGLILLPNVLWQIHHHFPTARQLKELAATQLVHVSKVNFLKDQLLFWVNSIILLVAAFVAFVVYRPFRQYRFFLWAYLISLTLFVCMNAKSYYALGLYPILFAFGAVYLEHRWRFGRTRYLRLATFVWIFLFAIPIFLYTLPLQSPEQILADKERYRPLGLLRWEDGKDHDLPQDYADMLGWRELAAKTDSIYAILSASGNTLVLCDNYGQAGAINYYSHIRDLKAVSFNADYINWMNLDKPVVNAILVKEYSVEDTTRSEEKPLFDTVSATGQITNPFAREKGTRIYALQGAKVDINSRIAKEIQEHMKY